MEWTSDGAVGSLAVQALSDGLPVWIDLDHMMEKWVGLCNAVYVALAQLLGCELSVPEVLISSSATLVICACDEVCLYFL